MVTENNANFDESCSGQASQIWWRAIFLQHIPKS